MKVYFNSHPHEEDDAMFVFLHISATYFNSHPHEEDDYIFFAFQNYYNISTHILTKRMTILGELRNSSTRHFNSHPHEEDDP